MVSHKKTTLPCVTWGKYSISRLLIGHNPLKGQSHYTPDIDKEMQEWYMPELGHDLEILKRCEECGLNTAQFGAPTMHSVLNRYKEKGGHIQWIATFYAPEGKDPAAELEAILAVNPKPIGIYYYGGRLDELFIQGRIEEANDHLKRLRDTGLLVGAGSHLPELMDHIESAGWDVDFYETCLYTVYTNKKTAKIDRDNEIFNDTDRDKMLTFIKKTSKPCIAFKILAGNRKCRNDQEIRETLAFTFSNIKETDVILIGMWQKYKDQVDQNVQWACEILKKQKRV
jgi:hypothetical protein